MSANLIPITSDGGFVTGGDITVSTFPVASPAPSINGFSSVSALTFTNGTSNVTINANSNLWNFDNTGNLTIPGSSGGMIKTVANGAIGITAINNGSDNPAQMMSWTVGETNPDTIISTYSSNALIQSNVNGIINTWTFDNVGNLTLPGSLIATSASPAPTLNGFSVSNALSISGGNITATGTVTSTGKIGYSVGGAATQTSTGQGVTINQLTGLVTLATRTYNAGDLEAFSIGCNKVAANDFVLVQMVDSVYAPSYNVVAYPNTILANTISVLVKTLETVGTDTPLLKFMIVKAPVA